MSKIAAGGLSAGVFLLWWPEHVPGEGLTQLVLRGLLWTMTFELLLLAFTPLELHVSGRLRRRTELRRTRVRDRLADVPTPARTGGAVALASLGLAGPLVLLADAPPELVKADERPKVVRQVIVERPVIRRQVVVRRVVGPAAADAAAAERQAAPARRAAAPATPKPKVVTRTVVKRVVREVPATAPAPQTTTAPAATEPQAPAATDPAPAPAQP